MKTAVLDLNEYKGKNHSAEQLNEFYQNWDTIPMIRLWLKARHFDTAAPIMVTQAPDYVLSFFQHEKMSRTVVLVHPNPKILEQLHKSLQEPGRTVHPFKRVEDANAFIKAKQQNKEEIHNVVVPKNLEVSYKYDYKSFLNKMFPKIRVTTVDNKNYRDTINLRTFQTGV